MTAPDVDVTSFEDDLASAFAADLASADPRFVFHADGTAYTADQWGVYLDDLPLDGDGHVIPFAVAVSAYALSHDPVYQESTYGLQFMIRAGGESAFPDSTRPVRSMVGAVTDAWLGRFPTVLSVPASAPSRRIKVKVVQYSYGAPMGRDAQRRSLRSVNFTALVERPSPHRL